ncbi:type VI secretion system tip protein VgrG [Caballeronia novacaledonica]|uniref:type VI secretion system Vgr family protein n=1 Tax=Caballeronia novacaledonica TaxID=1544861 RepID=UPI001EE2FB6A|nr:type VI secretion system Vgr family protein [Caballeronia novacaledonica]GJH07360.1 type VI secretion system tip protein VgrG [Caballeronia novacaledonica]
MNITQQGRVVEISGAALPQWAGQSVLSVTSLDGREKLGKLYAYTVALKTHHASALPVYKARALVDASKLVGTELSLSIAFEGKGEFVSGLPGNLGQGNVGAGTRVVSGLITQFALTGEDDKHTYYQATVRPWFWLATRNRENRIFQNKSVVEITQAVLDSKLYPFQYELRLAAPGLQGKYPKRDYVRQMWESDFHFLTRLWREWGVYFFMDDATLVLCDSPGGHRPHENMYDSIRYQPPIGARIDEEHIHRLKVSHAITAGAVTLTDYDPTLSRAKLTDKVERESFASFDNAEHYGWGEFSQPRAGATGLAGRPNDFVSEAHYLAGVRADALRARQLRLKGRGNLRGLAVGHTFFLTDHPDKAVNAEYLVSGIDLHIRNNGETSGEATYECRCDFALQSANAFFKNQLRNKPQCGAETAVVVGPDEQPMWVDGYARVKIQFIWDRVGRKDEQSSCWVRVSSPWQGSNYGFIALPRIGQEVTVSYHEGDPDRPFIADRQVNDFNQPPWQLPKNQALTGLRSRSLEGSQSNQVVMDDTPGKLQVQVASDHANSRLVLGYNTRIEGDTGRREGRGEGWELATDSWGVARANKGMLITTEARDGAEQSAKSMSQTIERLAQASDQHEELFEIARQHKAQSLEISQKKPNASLKTQNDAIRGDANGKAFPELSQANLVASSAAGMSFTAAQSVHVAASENLVFVSAGDVSQSSGRSLLATARDAISLFAHKLGLKLIAAEGKVEIQAQSDDLDLTAKQALRVLSTDANVDVAAKKEIVLSSGGAYIRIKDGDIEIHAPGKIDIKGAQRSFTGPTGRNYALPKLPDSELLDKFSLRFAALGSDDLLADEYWLGRSYKIFDGDQKLLAQGEIGADGRLPRIYSDTAEFLRLEIGSDTWNVHEIERQSASSDEALYEQDRDWNVTDARLNRYAGVLDVTDGGTFFRPEDIELLLTSEARRLASLLDE